MTIIYETENFTVESVDKPNITRTDGGHIRIAPKVRVLDRTKLSPEKAKEMMRLTMIAGEAMAKGMNNRGVDVGRINYQDNGNWSVFTPQGPYLHIHLYGRAKSSKFQKWGNACYFPHRNTGFYANFEPINEGDIAEIRRLIEEISKRDKYNLKNW